MPALLVIIVLGVLAFIGYQYVYKQEQPPQTVEQATQQAKEAAGEAVSKAREALTAAGQALGPAAEQAGEAVRQGAEQLRQGAEQLGQQAQQAASGAAQTVRETANSAAQSTQEAATDARSMVVDGVDLGNQMREAAGRARAALVGVTDAASAEAQLPTLKDVNLTLEGLQARLEALPGEARRGFANLVSETLPSVRETAERIKAIEGTGPELDGALDALVAKLESWSRAPA
jgi:cytoskeletal protein RodZ